MESRLRLLFLRTLLLRTLLLRTVVTALLVASTAACGLIGSRGDAAVTADPDAPVIDPRVERRGVGEPSVDRSDFEVGAFTGLISIEDFGSETVYGARIAYHISENLFAQATYGQTGDLGRTQAEELGNFDLLGGDRDFRYYNAAIGYNLLPGETFIGSRWAFNSALYVVAGAGQTTLGPDDHFTIMLGTGYRVLANDWLALHFGVQDHIFDNELTRAEKNTTHNIELSLGFSVFF